MSRLFTATAIAMLISGSVYAGGFEQYYGGSSQFANANAYNLSNQVLNIKSKWAGDVGQATGATANAANKSKCGCAGSQYANASAKNVSLQVANISSTHVGDISQVSGATAYASNVKSSH